MGRIKTKLIKRLTYQMIEQHGEHLSTDFEHNKKVAGADLQGASKKTRNVVAGFISRRMRRREE